MSSLKEQEYIKEYIKKSDGTEEVREVGIYHNLDDINVDSTDPMDHENYETSASTDFKFEDDPRKKLVAYEYWGEWDIHGDGTTEAIVGTWIDKTMIRLEVNPFPHKEIPFSIAAYMPRKGELRGQPDAELLAENQDMIGKMMRAANDITTTKAIGQKLVNENLFSNASEWDSYRAGNDAQFQGNMDPKLAIFQQNVEKIDPSVFQMIDLQISDAESMTGVKSAVGGGSSGTYKNVDATRSALDATAKRELGILRRLVIQIFVDIGSKTIQNQQVYASQEEVVRITNNEYTTIRREDLQGEFDLSIDVSTPEAENAKAEQLMKLMQTNQANMDPGLQKIFYTDLLRLWKMPEAQKAVETYEPEPDPAQEEMKQIQLMTAKLEMHKVRMEVANLAKALEDTDSKITERISRSKENEAYDGPLKLSQAEKYRAEADKLLAEASKLESETDEIDQSFLNDYNGVNREREVEDQEYAAQNTMDQEQQKGRQQALLNEQQFLQQPKGKTNA